MSKGSMRRPGKGYEEGHERIFGPRCLKHPDESIREERCPKCGTPKREKKK